MAFATPDGIPSTMWPWPLLGGGDLSGNGEVLEECFDAAPPLEPSFDLGSGLLLPPLPEPELLLCR
jgi:hypothetical protein